MVHFGTGGWRAIIGDEFIKSNIVKVGQAISNIIKDECINKSIVIGFDRRFISDISAKWLAEVFAGNGIKVYFIDKIAPTPMVMYSVKTLDLDYGVAVTASHNPAEYNGIKIFTKGGRDATVEVTNVIEETANKIEDYRVRAIAFEKGLETGMIQKINPLNEYVDTILNKLDLKAIRNKNLKILLDPMFGVSKTALQLILVTARCEVDVIHDRHDTMFGGRLPSPSAVTLKRLREMVVDKKYDLGIGTDGDADRLGIIDENGNFIHPNKIMSLLYYYLLKYKGWKGPVVRNVATTHLLDEIAKKYGEDCYEVPVGFKHVSSKMEETDAVIGGESSGGLTIRGHIKGKDGVFAAGLLVEMISVTGKRLARMLDELDNEFGKFEMVEFDCKFANEDKEKLVDILYRQKKLPEFNYEIEKVSYLDGVKVYFKNGGWIIARFSGTEPLIRIFGEMDDEGKANEIVDDMVEFLGVNDR
ncbi:phosphoglucomutase/phosphomannomutase family protein [Vallitalea guaymasensis]|uniref:Phosphoglucomutase/phosphomannomutase family protein n=1 Tax=Vallitalea guaymasensis TaxID=1185412 RepID=A0A8J8M9R3_9FIRM|nr:phosphoglucomutase/phosphomannomutase family protein [Vallitalea guaymasensis]QUH28725.1 phosphoglucomutase/phosphomannomutase family protein [Vallitalea guaymasensis]